MKMHWLIAHRAALSRGLPPEAANSYISRVDGTSVTVDDLFVGADHFADAGGASTGEGPGKELALLLHRIGVQENGCNCSSRAAKMNAWGADMCEQRIEEIVGWLRESAAERGLPFVDMAGRLLVKRAIANARRKEAARAEGSSLHPQR